MGHNIDTHLHQSKTLTYSSCIQINPVKIGSARKYFPLSVLKKIDMSFQTGSVIEI